MINKEITNKKINDFKEGELIEGFYLIKSIQVKNNKNGKKYLDLDIADKSADINAKYWNLKPEEEELFTTGILVKIRGEVTSFDSKLQLKINLIRKVTEEDQQDPGDFVPSAPYDSRQMYAEIMDLIDNFTDQDFKNICRDVYESKKAKLLYFPAAQRNHHSIYGGLLYHIRTMLSVAESLAEIYTFINKDLLYSGILLHDIAKIDEMDSNELGIVSDYTFEGQLLGHIIQAIKLVNETGKRLGADPEKIIILEHLILSHHNEPEYGSPKKPMLPEGELLCHIDMIDARMFDMKKVLDGVEKGEFSEKIWLLDKRKLYKF